MRIATYNVEWFNSLFGRDGRLLEDDHWSGRYDVKRHEQLAALGIVFSAIDADAVMIIEAPDTSPDRSTVKALENFAAAMGLRARRALIGFENDTQQEIALLYDPDHLTATHDPKGAIDPAADDPHAPRFDSQFKLDLDVDARKDTVTFSKPPLEVALETAAGRVIRMIGTHVKSKAPHGARNARDVMRMSIENRRKQLAQSIWLRRRIDEHLAEGESLIVLGDLNDGPGLDEYETLFGRSSVEILLGEGDVPSLYDPHAAMALFGRMSASPTSARFWNAEQKRYLQALLDYIMISQDLMQLGPNWRIWHPFDDPCCYKVPELREALLTASDHFPVTLDINL